MLHRYYQIALFFCCLLLLAGCGSARFTSTLKPSNNPALSVGDVQFRLASHEFKSGGGKPHLDAWVSPVKETLSKRVVELYPRVFGSDWGAVPVTVEVSSITDESMIGAMLTGFTLGLIPFPSSNTFDFTVVTSLVDERGDKLPIAPVAFQRKDAIWLTLIGPLGCLPIFGESDVPRSTMFLFANMEDYGEKSLRLTGDTLVEAIVSSLRKAPPERLAAIAKARQARMKKIDIEGKTYWSFLSPHFSTGVANQASADGFALLLYLDRPNPGAQPVEEAIIARRDGSGRWLPVSAYLRQTTKGLVRVTALLENGTPGRVVVTEVSEPPLEDFIPLPTVTGGDRETIEVMRWSSRILVQAKNRTLPKVLKTKATGELLDLVTLAENAFLDLSRMAELAKDRAQKAVADGVDGGAARELSLTCRERADILKPVLAALKQEVAGRGGN